MFGFDLHGNYVETTWVSKAKESKQKTQKSQLTVDTTLFGFELHGNYVQINSVCKSNQKNQSLLLFATE